MSKKIMFLILLSTSINSVKAIILTNGKQAPLPLVNKVYSTIKNLSENNRIEMINDLDLAVNSTDNIIRPNLGVWGWAKREFTSQEALLHEFIKLELCDKSGKIDSVIADIIANTVTVTIRKGICPIFYKLQSPISWKNYFMPSYWLGKE